VSYGRVIVCRCIRIH